MVVDFAVDPITPETASAVETTVQGNMWLSQISLKVEMGDDLEGDFDDSFEDDDHEDNELIRKKGFGRMMSSLFDSTRRDRPPREIHGEGDSALKVPLSARQLDAIHLTCASSLRAREFEAMCSAIVVNQTARKLSLSLWLNWISDGDLTAVSAHWWKWIAYACFSKRARDYSSLESLALLSVSSLTVADMESFAAVLQSEHPEEEVFGCPRGQVPERDASLLAGADIRWHFDSQGEPVLTSPCLKLDEPVTLLRTFSDDGVSEWIDAMIPGYGRCQVRRRDLSFLEPRNKAPASTGITALTIGFNKRQGGIAHGPRTPIDKDAILRYCPMLEDLVLSDYYVDVRLDFREYRLVKNPTFDLHFDWNDITALATELSDAQNPLNRANELDNSLSNYDHVTLLERHLPALLQMLKSNKSLEYLEVVVPPDYEGYSEDFYEQHVEPICRTPKLALLSGLMPRSPYLGSKQKRGTGIATACSMLLRMDPHVITEIFAYAAEPVYRAVYFRNGTGDERDEQDDLPL
ncbi:hypothetical protein PHYSODRAFT_306214 [Phytophthora sojae]|uniref:Uncharacterized protein n=1 Tax=Phytophthora sojae (strain P6497) TaxID=1094619 RepID=G5A8F8_PHYSP|nr:hypothetical protein PHYSODRAFT_306214 [Phytophthora sojae]EGZ08184.1 hypothetical protein PHYSODRAFT_306214 [Phytophthora sojae]|eukprot:XP_009536356.1 hypothetical protein PHYSODRAFT_306214 [Phytophthora sojae]